MYKPAIFISLLTMTALGWKQDRRTPVVPLEGSRMFLEWTPGQEVVVRITAESEEELERVRVLRPNGVQLIDLGAGNKGGLTSLEVELREPDPASLVRDYAAGKYYIQAATVGGKMARGQVNLSLDLPAAPRVVQPRSGELLPASNLTVFWLPDPSASGYELQLEQGEDDGLRVKLPPERSSFQVPREFLLPGTRTTLEVTAIGTNGNRTVTEVSFFTRP
jgi:hypothetical protein